MFELENSAEISIDSETKPMIVVTYFCVVEAETGLVHETREEYGTNCGYFE